MSEGLEALNKLCEYCHSCIQRIPSKGDRPFKECPFRHISNDYCEEYETIKKELKVLETFKHALTIEYKEQPLPTIDTSVDDYIFKQIKQEYTIIQNELDQRLRNSLKERVLKNAFPKELKALLIIKATGILRVFETLGNERTLESMIDSVKLTKEEYDLLKEVL